jgi:hypothetical protein
MNSRTLLVASCLVVISIVSPAAADTEYFFSGQACNAQAASFATTFGSTELGRGNESTTSLGGLYCQVLGYEDRDVDLESGRVYYRDQNGSGTGYLYAWMFFMQQDGSYLATGAVGSSSSPGGTPGFGTPTHTGDGYLEFGGLSVGTDVVAYGFAVVLPAVASGNTSFAIGYQVNQTAN